MRERAAEGSREGRGKGCQRGAVTPGLAQARLMHAAWPQGYPGLGWEERERAGRSSPWLRGQPGAGARLGSEALRQSGKDCNRLCEGSQAGDQTAVAPRQQLRGQREEP